MTKSCPRKTGDQEMPYLPQQANACQRQDLHVYMVLRPQQMAVIKTWMGQRTVTCIELQYLELLFSVRKP